MFPADSGRSSPDARDTIRRNIEKPLRNWKETTSAIADRPSASPT
jgi:hypothetical protein